GDINAIKRIMRVKEGIILVFNPSLAIKWNASQLEENNRTSNDRAAEIPLKNEKKGSKGHLYRYPSILHRTIANYLYSGQVKVASQKFQKVKKERKTWDKEEWREKAKQKDEDERERMQQNEELMKKGKKPGRRNPAVDMPKPTETMKQREGSLELDKNLGKTMVVTNATGRGPGQPGFYCEICKRNHKDSNNLRMIGQSTRVERSTVEQVREKIAALREQTKEARAAKTFDFERRLAEIKAKEDALRAERKAQRKAAKESKRLDVINAANEDLDMQSKEDITAMMGFSGFGTTKR
ncbi:2175_t:CDS:2, partial [Acaulospora colombiana]